MCPRIVDKESLASRELELLAAALSIIENRGVAGLNMDRLVAQVPYSKGTVYSHFSSKEDLLTSLCIQGMEILAGLFRKAANYSGSTRERGLGIHLAYLLYALLYPNRFLLVISAMSPTLFERTSEQRKQAFQEVETALFGAVVEIVDDAITAGDFKLPDHMTKQQVAFSNWSMGFGTIALLAGEFNDCECRRGLNLEHEMFNNVNLLLDGMGWKPLSNSQSHAVALQRIAEEAFSDEMSQLAERGIRLDFTRPPVPVGATGDLFG
ncbi:MAG: TetR/AcrR family transcriptional regulator [Candidatus Sedimenticola sp. 20ELBAFRAG]